MKSKVQKYVDDFIEEFIEETTLAYHLDGKYEMKEYASYWIQDIYHFSSTLDEMRYNAECDQKLCHELNPYGNVFTEYVADQIYEGLKQFKLFAYYFEIKYKHLRELLQSMEYYVQTYFSDAPTSYSGCKHINENLYGVTGIRPLPLSTYPVFSYIGDDFTPDVVEYEGLRRSLDSLKNVFTLSYAMTNRLNYKKNAKEIFSSFKIPIEKNIEISLSDEHVEMMYYLNRIKSRSRERMLVYSGKYESNYTGLGLLDTLMSFLSEAIEHVIGKPKEKYSDGEAIYGILPMKDQANHGLKIDFESIEETKRLIAKEAQSVNLIKETLFLEDNPVTSTSYGVDSVLVQHLVNKVYPSIDVYHGKTGLDFPEIYDIEKKLIENGIVESNRLFYGKNKTSYWSLVDDYGFNFERKGKRKSNINRSEKCCMELKHIPFLNAIKEHGWNVNFAGLRADESRARELAAKRDGPIYFAKSWNLFRVNPIIFWTDDDVWQYTKANDIPYASIYDMVLLSDNGDEIFKPRIGCWACMLSAKYGYLKWLRAFKPKLYRHIMVDKGLLELLYAKKLGYELSLSETGKEQLVCELDGFDSDYVLGFLEQRPCFFDDTLVNF